MVDLLPFRGLVPVGDVRERTVPGDATSTARLRLRSRHPRHVAWLESDGALPPADVDEWIAEGALREDAEPSLRVVEQVQVDGHRVTALLADVPLGQLVEHEQVDPPSVRRRAQRHAHEQVHLRPLLALLAEPVAGEGSLLDRLRALPDELRMRDDAGTVHRVAVVPSVLAREVARTIAPAGALLADGHHRVAAARGAGTAALPALVCLAGAAPQLLPVWRVVVSEAPHDVLRAWLAREAHPDGPLTVRWRGQVTRLRARPGVLPVVAGARLARAIPGHSRTTTTADAVAVAVAERDGAVTIAAPPPTIAEVLAAVGRDGPLPPKSTAFVPKPRVGLVLRRIRT